MTILVEIVTPRRLLYSGHVDMAVLPGVEGQMGVMERHAPLMTILDIGEIVLMKGGAEEDVFAVSGGVVEVRPDKVTILADTAERADEIDTKRAEDARERARQFLIDNPTSADRRPVMESALRRSSVRLKVADRRRRRPRPGMMGSADEE